MPSGSSTSRSRSIATSRNARSTSGPRRRRHTRTATNAPAATTTSAAASRIQYSDVTSYSLCNLLFYKDLPAIELRRKLVEARLDRGARGRPLEQLGERRRHLDDAPDDWLDDRLELRGVGRRADDPRDANPTRRREVVVNPEAGRSVRTPDSAVTRVVLANLAADRLVVNGIGFDRGAQAGEVRQ